MSAGARILIAEDMPELRRLFGVVLSKYGFEILAASDGEEALRLARTEKPDLILMDVGLPGIDGVEATRRLKADPATASVPIIMLTSDMRPGTIEAALEAGAMDYLVKVNVKFDELLGLLRNAIAQGRSEEKPAPPEEAAPAEKKPSGTLLSRADVETRLKKVLELKALPAIASEIIEVTSHPGSTAQQLTDTLQRDSALTTRVLRMANSAFYALHGRVQNLTQAVQRIGFRGIREMALAITIVDHHRNPGAKGGLDRMEFWRHSLGCAVLAKDLAVLCGLGPDQVEEAFLGGLLHDVGKTILDDHFHEAYVELLERATSRGAPLYEMEREGFGIDHAEVARHVLGKWSLPEALIDPIAFHHLPWSEAMRQARGDARAVALVRLANILTKAAGIGSAGDQTLEEVPEALASLLKLSHEKVQPLMASLGRNVEDLTQILLLHGGTEVPPRRGTSPWIEGEILLVRGSRRVTIDVFQFLLERLTGSLKMSTNPAESGAQGPPAVVVARVSGIQDAESFAEKGEGLWGKGKRPRIAVLTDEKVSDKLQARLEGLGAVILERPFFIPALLAFLSRRAGPLRS